MNNVSILRHFLVIAALFFVVTSCDKNDLAVDAPAPQLQLNEIPPVDEDSPMPDSYDVAKITKDGHVYEFVAIGEEEDMAMVVKLNEFAEEYDEVNRIAEIENPFEAFMILTDDNVKVPLRIAKTADESIVQASKREISQSSSLLEIQYTSDNTAASSRACHDVGYGAFKKRYCGTRASKFTDIRICNSEQRTDLYRAAIFKGTAWALLKVRTWTNVNCGTVKLQMYTNKYDYITPRWEQKKYYERNLGNGIWWVNVYSKTLQRRSVWRYNRSGKFRSFTRFSNQ